MLTRSPQKNGWTDVIQQERAQEQARSAHARVRPTTGSGGGRSATKIGGNELDGVTSLRSDDFQRFGQPQRRGGKIDDRRRREVRSEEADGAMCCAIGRVRRRVFASSRSAVRMTAVVNRSRRQFSRGSRRDDD